MNKPALSRRILLLLLNSIAIAVFISVVLWRPALPTVGKPIGISAQTTPPVPLPEVQGASASLFKKQQAQAVQIEKFDPKPGFRLLGILINQERAVAVVASANTPATILSVGDQIENWLLVEISKSRAIFGRDDRQITLTLDAVNSDPSSK